ncbi:MAG: ATP-dependent RecD-like DNA helicase [Clostridiaceae bacterium]|nr:ATP-dependent RecD-like DNA helicase [Clostridiaceae bacterium]
MEQIEGIVEDIIFYNEDNGYAVCGIRAGRRLITMVGNMPGISVGETLYVSGSWAVHQSYGKQFKVSSFERRLPKTTDAIFKYLSSGVIKGVGEATARKIVDLFGDETLYILQFEPHRLSEIKGISENKALKIGQAFMEREQIRQTVMFLQQFGISTIYAVKVWKKFGKNSVDEIKRNPYRLTDEDINIGFKIADRIAITMGIDMSSRFRLQSGILYVLSRAVRNGHVYLPENILVPYTAELLNASDEAVSDALASLVFEDSVYIEKSLPDRVYLSAFYKAEQYVCRKLNILCNTAPRKKVYNPEETLREVEQEEKVEYDEYQREAIRRSALNSVLVVTGGPGTGKTTLIRGIIALFEKQGMNIALAAPTGRAAKRMAETTGYEAKTIHRLLEVGFTGDEERMEFKKNERDPIDADVIIIDEVSMVDILLMQSLLKAVEPGTRLVLVGDVDQLPSVGPGRVLSDIIESNCVEVIYLNQIFRQAGESMIVLNAHKINKGIYPELNIPDSDFYFVQRNNPEDTANAVIDLTTSHIPEKFGLDPMKDIQVLTPTKKGAAGVFSLNAALQNRLNPKRADLKKKQFRDMVFREKDRVMQIKNNYSLAWKIYGKNNEVIEGEGVFNGDMGIITGIDPEENCITVTFDDGKVCEYTYDMLDELELSYAITVHKSQGSEFSAVVMALSGIPPMLTCRNLLYTGVTRACRLVVLVGETRILKKMVENITEKKRFTGLAEKLATLSGSPSKCRTCEQ